MLALAIFGIVFAAYMLTAMVTFFVYNALPLDRTPAWFERFYEIITFGLG